MVLLDVLIIGGGPHAMTLASMLSYPDPNPIEHRETAKLEFEPGAQNGKPDNKEDGVSGPPLVSLQVVDAYGEWACLWRSQFAALNIPHLRSHALVHTDPVNKYALQEFASKHKRQSELHGLPDRAFILDENAFFNDTRLGRKEKKRLNMASNLGKNLPFTLPGTKLSVDFFQDQVKRYNLEKVLVKGSVTRITPTMEEKTGKKMVKYFRVRLEDGAELKARQVVVATGPTRAQVANIPLWVSQIEESYPEERLQHTVDLMHSLARNRDKATPVCETGQRVMVVGGGLTSAHVVSIALQQGASHVTWVMRKHLQLKQFDVGDVESLVGRYSHVEHGIKMDGQAFLRQFFNERSLHRRLAMIGQARKGGAVTPEAYVQLKPFILKGQVEVKTYCQVSQASWCYRKQAWKLTLNNGDQWEGDSIWLATGCKLDVREDPLLSEVRTEFPIQVLDGWPCVSENLQWADGCPLYLMGQYAALQVGPHAVNLAGGQAASLRIANWILRQRRGVGGAILGAGKSKTED
ncbi:uncharacterized protein LOC144194697 [Stigmatopora nigra]